MVQLHGRFHDEAVSLWKRLKSVSLFGSEAEEREERYGNFQIESVSTSLVVIPPTDDITEVDIRYRLLQPFADAHIYWNEEQEELIYEIDEPDLSEQEEEIYERTKDALEKKISVPLSDLDTSQQVIEYLQDEVHEIWRELGLDLGAASENKLMYYFYRNFGGLREIEPLMNDPYIEDIGCSGTGIPTYVIHTKFGSIKTDLTFDDEDNLRQLIVKLAERADKYVSYSDPLLDGTLPDGSRVNASLTDDVTTKGPTFSIRKFQEVPFSAVDLLELGTVDLHTLAYLWMCLEYQKSGLVIGGTAAGKTTLLNALVSFIPPELKIVSIEDTRELQLPHENWIPSVTRAGASGEEDDIGMYQLLRESFRQNPDYVVVGEVRGKEASVLFQGMASGHPSLSTMHASSPADVVSRLTTDPINLSPSLVETMDFIASMTHAREWGENARRVKAVHEVERVSQEGSPRTNEYLSWSSVDDSFTHKEDSTVLDTIQQQFGKDPDEIAKELKDRKTVLGWLQQNGLTHFEKVSTTISEYYTNKEKVMNMISEDTDLGFEDVVLESDSSGARPKRVAEKDDAMMPDIGGEGTAVTETPPYESVVDRPVSEVKETVEEEGLDPQNVLEAEERGKNRTELVDWLRQKTTETGAADGSEDLFEDTDLDENPFS